MADVPGLTIEWPDPLELPDMEPIEDDGSADFTDENPLEAGPLLIDPNVVELTEQLELAFPSEEGAFPQQDDFVDQFRMLSSIEAYDDTDTNVGQLGVGRAFDMAGQMRPDYARYLFWFLQRMAINAGRPEAEEKILRALRRGGWDL